MIPGKADRAEGPLYVQESRPDRAEGPLYVQESRPDRAEDPLYGSWRTRRTCREPFVRPGQQTECAEGPLYVKASGANVQRALCTSRRAGQSAGVPLYVFGSAGPRMRSGV